MITARREPHDPESVLRVTMESVLDLNKPEQGLEHTSSADGVLAAVQAWLASFIESAASAHGSTETSPEEPPTTD